jgi:hypothetical protein
MITVLYGNQCTVPVLFCKKKRDHRWKSLIFKKGSRIEQNSKKRITLGTAPFLLWYQQLLLLLFWLRLLFDTARESLTQTDREGHLQLSTKAIALSAPYEIWKNMSFSMRFHMRSHPHHEFLHAIRHEIWKSRDLQKLMIYKARMVMRFHMRKSHEARMG